ncbi:MAG: sporulation integral membrane protein YtvI [Clostridia bacterium]|nr:sporulation integral membrane protein YtvI [Clostridia bacterium]
MQKTEKKALIFLLSVLCAVLFFRYLFFAALPFALAFAAASLLHRPAMAISKKLRLSYKAVSVGLAVCFVSLFLGLSAFLIWQTAVQIGNFARATIGGENGILQNLSDIFSRAEAILSNIPFFSGKDAVQMREQIAGTVSDMIKTTLVSTASRIPALAGKVVSAIPQIFVFFAVTILSAVYFCKDYEKITAFFKEKLSDKHFKGIARIASVFRQTAVRFVRSYLLLFLFTFSALFLGYTLLGEAYSFLFALVTATVDSLPIFGTGTVLIPLALYHFIIGDISYGIGACLLYLAVTVLRQILEPKILGAGMGIHPLLMLTAMYTGLRLFGIFGMLLAPLSIAILKNLIGAFQKPHEKTS